MHHGAHSPTFLPGRGAYERKAETMAGVGVGFGVGENYGTDKKKRLCCFPKRKLQPRESYL